MVNKNLMLGVSIPALLFAVLSGAFVACSLMGSGGSSGSWRDFRDGGSLIGASERVLVAKYLDAETHEIPTVTADDGRVIGSVTEQFRRFRIVKTLKGEGKPGDIVHVVTSVGYKTALAGGGSESHTYDTIDLTANQDYVLFLDGRAKQEGYPSQYGDTLWARPGEPGIARLDAEGRLSFIATDRYKDTIEGEGLERVKGSDAPFEMTEEDITSSTPAE